MDAACCPEPETAADEPDGEQLQKAFPKIGIASQDHGSDAGSDLWDGKKALLHLAPGTKEDTASYREFFQDLRSNRQLHSR